MTKIKNNSFKEIKSCFLYSLKAIKNNFFTFVICGIALVSLQISATSIIDNNFPISTNFSHDELNFETFNDFANTIFVVFLFLFSQSLILLLTISLLVRYKTDKISVFKNKLAKFPELSLAIIYKYFWISLKLIILVIPLTFFLYLTFEDITMLTFSINVDILVAIFTYLILVYFAIRYALMEFFVLNENIKFKLAVKESIKSVYGYKKVLLLVFSIILIIDFLISQILVDLVASSGFPILEPILTKLSQFISSTIYYLILFRLWINLKKDDATKAS